MNRFACLALISAILALLLTPSTFAQSPVVVELFTSEGCSSCPPADAVLMKLDEQPPAGTQLILLGEHVDYWNYIGWTDRFSSSQFSQRQSAYGSALHSSTYTPQMVIDGRVQFVGNELPEVERKIAAAAKDPKPAQVTLHWQGDRLHVTVQSPQQSKVLLALVEDGLTTKVDAGENGGRTLHHAAVVRQLRELGKADTNMFDATVDVSRKPDWNPSKLKVAVLAQDASSMQVLGAATVSYIH